MEKESDKHGGTRRFRAHKNARHRLLRQGHDRSAQTDQRILRNEDTGQAEGGQAEAGRAHTEREAHPAGYQFSVPCQSQVPFQRQFQSVHGARVCARRRNVLPPAEGGPIFGAPLAFLRRPNCAGLRVPALPRSDIQRSET